MIDDYVDFYIFDPAIRDEYEYDYHHNNQQRDIMTEERNKSEFVGRLRVRITSAGLTETGGDSPVEQIAVQGIVAEDGEHSGKQLTFYGGLASDAAIKFTIDQVRNAGFRGNDVSDMSSAVGNEAVFVVFREEYPAGSDEWKTKVRYINSLDGGGFRSLDEDKKKAVSASINDRIAMLGLSDNAPPPPRSKAPTTPGIDDPDDDIGF